jgi:hypothetical protein
MTTIEMKVRPTSQTPEAVRQGPSLALYHQIQQRETDNASTTLVVVVRIALVIPRHASLWIVLNCCLALAVSQSVHQTRDE